MLNADLKRFSKALVKRLKTLLSSLITLQNTAYVQIRHIGEGGRLISDILDEIYLMFSDKLNIGRCLVTVNIEKAFDFLDHGFLLVIFIGWIDFPNNFIGWIKILTNQESCVINGGNTRLYFKLEKDARQGDPISAYLFIIALEIIFAMIQSNPNIKSLNIFNHTYL